ncbi:MAG: D-2-hydroxyacid dehydrogenase [Gemmatimonadetes bacterium]|nr:D-2-hydroxyacid dehydrogenase [Gemmatimonadota bacterium]
MLRIVLDMNDVRPLWALPDWVPERVRAAAPHGWEVVVVRAGTSGAGDGTLSASPEALEAVASAEIYLGLGVAPQLLRAGPQLRWVHTGTAGVGSLLSPELRQRDILFTNSAGVHGPAMGETVLAMILYFARGLDFAVRGQAEGRWWTEPFDGVDSPVREISGSTVGILGLGGIGREVAKRVLPLGARVLATKRRAEAAAPSGLDGVDLLTGPAALLTLARSSDYLVVSAPETAETRGIVSAALLVEMKREAVLVNVSRGRLVDEQALVESLRARRLRGAALDVFHVEPLPADHPLWKLTNVLIIPHVSASSYRYWERQCELIEENLKRYQSGRPLLNLVDTQAGY